MLFVVKLMEEEEEEEIGGGGGLLMNLQTDFIGELILMIILFK
jgi:hypothetical protein